MKITLPLEIYYTNKKNQAIKDKKMRLNLNTYRNTHYFTLNTVKKEFGELVVPLVKNMKPITSKCELTYTLFPKRKVDVNNVCCIIDKFFCDVLVNEGLLPDDNCEIVRGVNSQFGEYDKENERCEVEIEVV